MKEEAKKTQIIITVALAILLVVSAVQAFQINTLSGGSVKKADTGTNTYADSEESSGETSNTRSYDPYANTGMVGGC